MRTDWEAVRTAFVMTDKSLSEIAELFKIGFDNLKHRAAKEGWTTQRRAFKVTTTNQAIEKRSSEMATDIAQFSVDELKLVKAGFALVAEEMKARKPAKDIATALKGFQEVRMRATGEAVDTDKDIKIKVEYDKE